VGEYDVAGLSLKSPVPGWVPGTGLFVVCQHRPLKAQRSSRRTTSPTSTALITAPTTATPAAAVARTSCTFSGVMPSPPSRPIPAASRLPRNG
jgi:hypothetical protein